MDILNFRKRMISMYNNNVLILSLENNFLKVFERKNSFQIINKSVDYLTRKKF